MLPDKGRILESIRTQLKTEIDAMLQAARAAHEAATHEESKAEDSHDTQSIEAGYLAGAQAQRAIDAQAVLELFSRMESRPYKADEPAGAGALVELESEDGKISVYLLASLGGGLNVRCDGTLVQVVTALSPLGEELFGRRSGESFEIDQRGETREWEIKKIV